MSADVAAAHRERECLVARQAAAAPLVQDDPPGERPLLTGQPEAGLGDERIHGGVGVEERPIPEAAQPEPHVQDRKGPAQQTSVPRQHQSIQRTSAGRGQAHERLHVRVAADHAIEGHDVGGVDLRCLRHEVAIDERKSFERAASTRFSPCRLDRGRRGVDQDGPRGACPEQLVIDDADPTADVEHARRADAAVAEHRDEHRGRVVGTVPSIALEILFGALLIEDLEATVAAARVHAQLPKIASSSNGAVVSSWS